MKKEIFVDILFQFGIYYYGIITYGMLP